MLWLLFALGNVQVGLCPYFAWQQTSQPSIRGAGFCSRVYFFIKSGDFESQLELPLRAISQHGEWGFIPHTPATAFPQEGSASISKSKWLTRLCLFSISPALVCPSPCRIHAPFAGSLSHPSAWLHPQGMVDCEQSFEPASLPAQGCGSASLLGSAAALG